MRAWLLGVTSWAATACLHRPSLPADATAALIGASERGGALVYQGTVHPRETDHPPRYRYERRVQALGEGMRSSHVTFSTTGEPMVLHQADHGPAYALTSFQEIHAQTGLVGRVDVSADGTATYQTTIDGRTRTRVEPPGDPLHVGPTLFGFALENWDALLAGDALPFRFAVLSQRRSYGFTLEQVDGPAGTVTLEMRPTGWLIEQAVPPAHLVFDADSRSIVRYTGIVPPLDVTRRRPKPLDATVIYAHTSAVYR